MYNLKHWNCLWQILDHKKRIGTDTTHSAAKGLDKDEKEKDSGHYIRKERYAGACQRSFYVGEDIEQEDVKAEFKHGILKLFVPKKEAKKAVEENKYIAIEG